MKTILLIDLFLFTACDNTLESERNELSKSLKKWNLSKPDNYSYEYQLSCYCSIEFRGSFKITVEKNQIVDINYVGDYPNEIDSTRIDTNRLYISSIFTWIEEAIDEDPDDINVDYDNEFGFPSKFSVDYKKNTSDDEFNVKISNFIIHSFPQ